MATIILADDGISFDGRTPELGPLGGAESALIQLVETLADRGHDITVYNKCEAETDIRGVKWRQIEKGVPETADLFIANRGDKVLNLCKKAKATVFWTHNPCRYMVKARYLTKLFLRRPIIVFIGTYHAETLPSWVPDGGRRTIPYGTPEAFIHAEPADTPPGPRAIFTSNPLRGLDWLLDRWVNDIEPHVPGAELHVFSGAATYGEAGARKSDEMSRILDRATNMADRGVRLRSPVQKTQLMDELRMSRVMLYRGDINETYCASVAEAQAMGVPAVLQPIGSMPERVVDGETGFIAASDAAFGEAACKILANDDLWKEQHQRALDIQRRWRWTDAAAEFEKLINVS